MENKSVVHFTKVSRRNCLKRIIVIIKYDILDNNILIILTYLKFFRKATVVD